MLMTMLWAATTVLMGLRYERAQVQALIKGVHEMIFGIRGIEESWVYQDIIAKGRAEGRAEGEAKGRAEGAIEEARNALLRLGRKKLGEPDARVLCLLSELADLDRLNLLLESVLDAERWDDLFPRLPS
jgi:predicted transposase YdaD